MWLAAEVGQQAPLWQTAVISTLSGLVGGLLALTGSWLTQQSTKKRESERWERELQKQRDDRVAQVYLDAAEFAENTRAWLKTSGDPFIRAELATLSVHENQLSARIRLFGGRSANAVWIKFMEDLGVIRAQIAYGNIAHDKYGQEYLEDSKCEPRAEVSSVIVLLAFRQLIDGRDQVDWNALESGFPESASSLDHESYQEFIKEWFSSKWRSAKLGGIE
ncbi:hypothetical protein O7632_10240 [Solwaraspora sp. WMMD406]|uniref:hypothetical protein n=1 Tax=Solwaraspora sp. WMMD406 TaxID=3016095 RepID=UPI0024167316|nr:hypothetical protein [Solwaraspora sp. WMMD406]MDG4764480.1 hypothetical protein [Solwaraspora sp. WMMD406]